MRALLADFERDFDPATPATGSRFGLEIVDYGEVSTLLALAALPGRVLKRMSGFPSAEAAEAYAGVVRRYITMLRADGVEIVPTEIVTVAPAPGRHVAYLVQPRLAPARLGQGILRHGADEALHALIAHVLATVRQVLARNGSRPEGRTLAIDAQLSNWHWPEEPGARPALLDVGTPFMYRDGRLEVGEDVFLRAYLGPLRWWLRRRHAVDRYVEEYFHFDLAVLDLLGNFHKEGAAARLPAAVRFVNEWIGRQADGAGLGCIDEAAVRAYYRRDAATLEMALRARRLTRFVTTRLLGRRYDFVLPGRIRR